jgi:hypothetical protein
MVTEAPSYGEYTIKEFPIRDELTEAIRVFEKFQKVRNIV